VAKREKKDKSDKPEIDFTKMYKKEELVFVNARSRAVIDDLKAAGAWSETVIPAVESLCSDYVARRRLDEKIRSLGPIITGKSNGMLRANPAILAKTAINRSIMQQEAELGIAVARRDKARKARLVKDAKKDGIDQYVD